MADHTPVPWNAGGSLILSDDNKHLALVLWRKADGTIIKGAADMSRHAPEVAEHDANAAFIVRACNNHDRMLAALKRAESDIGAMTSTRAGEAEFKARALADVRAAIAAAERA